MTRVARDDDPDRRTQPVLPFGPVSGPRMLLLTESDVEQKLVWPMLTSSPPVGLGFSAADVVTKLSIRWLELGQGSNRANHDSFGSRPRSGRVAGEWTALVVSQSDHRVHTRRPSSGRPRRQPCNQEHQDRRRRKRRRIERLDSHEGARQQLGEREP